MKHIYTARPTCRICAGRLTTVWDLGLQFVYNLERNDAAPLELCICETCELVQLRHTVKPDYLYRGNYYYKSGVNDMMRAALKDVVESAWRCIDLADGDIVVDIGANDGTLLSNYGPGLKRVAFEPSDIADLIPDNMTVIQGYFSARTYNKLIDSPASVITACAMFYDLEDPISFIRDVSKILADDGVFIIQMNYLVKMIENNTFDNISHEHLIHYNIRDVIKLCGMAGLVVVDAQLNEVNGGSVRLYIQKSVEGRPDGKSDRLRDLLEYEDRFYEDMGVEGALGSMMIRCEDECAKLKDFVKNHKVCTLGASTRGYVILQYAGITDHIDALIDRNPEKVGKSLGNMTIFHEAALDDYAYALVLPYHFMDEFKVRYAKFLERGGTLIRPLPKFESISSLT